MSSGVEAVELSGEGDKDPCDDVKSRVVKANLSVDLTSASVHSFTELLHGEHGNRKTFGRR